MNSKGKRLLNVCLLAVGLISFLGTGRALHAQPQINAVVNAASGHSTVYYGLVGGGVYSIYGNFPGATVSNTTVKLCASTCGQPYTVLYAGTTQINFQIPWQSSWFFLQYVDLYVIVNGVSSSAWYSNTYDEDPSLYGCTYSNPWAQQYPNYNLVGDCGYGAVDQSSGPPILIFYGNTFWYEQFTCSGNCTNYLIDGIYFKAGNVPGTILAATAFSDGEWQVNVQLGSTVPAGSQPVVLTVDGTAISFNLTFN